MTDSGTLPRDKACWPELPVTAPISELPLALVTTADVPLMIALHITSLVALARASRQPYAAGPSALRSRATALPRAGTGAV
jgi:hypothetical protein